MALKETVGIRGQEDPTEEAYSNSILRGQQEAKDT